MQNKNNNHLMRSITADEKILGLYYKGRNQTQGL